MHAARSRSWAAPTSAFAGFRFPAEVIVVAVRWYLRYGLSSVTSRSCSPNAASTPTTSASTDGYRAVDQYGQVIDVLVSVRRDGAAARRFFTRALRMHRVTSSEVVTDAAPGYPGVLDELVPAAWHHVEQYANNPIEADHSQLKRRLRPMRAL